MYMHMYMHMYMYMYMHMYMYMCVRTDARVRDGVELHALCRRPSRLSQQLACEATLAHPRLARRPGVRERRRW